MNNNYQGLEREGVGREMWEFSDRDVEESSAEEGAPSTELNGLGRGARQRGQTVQRP